MRMRSRKAPDRVLPSVFVRLLIDQTRDRWAGRSIVRRPRGLHEGCDASPAIGCYGRVETVRCKLVEGDL